MRLFGSALIVLGNLLGIVCVVMWIGLKVDRYWKRGPGADDRGWRRPLLAADRPDPDRHRQL